MQPWRLYIGLTAGFLLLSGFGVIGYYGRPVMKLSANQASPAISGSLSGQAAQSSAAVYTFNQVAEHHTEQSCWATLNGSVYDLTSWVSQHPGGPEAILSLCGTDATQAFEQQHGSSRRANAELILLKIGALAS